MFISRDIHLFMRAFLIYMRPIVEYNSTIWSPSTARDIDAVESVQVTSFHQKTSYSKELVLSRTSKMFNIIFSLELRRHHTDLFWCYKIVFGLVYVNLDDLFVFSPCQ